MSVVMLNESAAQSAFLARIAQAALDAAHNGFDSDCDLALVPTPSTSHRALDASDPVEQPVEQPVPEWVTLHVIKGEVDGDITMVPYDTYAQVAQRFANDHKMVVGVRCAATDTPVAYVRPTNDEPAAATGKTGKTKAEIRYDFEQRVLERKANEAIEAAAKAAAAALKSASPKVRSPRIAAAGGTATPKAPRAPKTAPTPGTIEFQIMQLALRPEGVSAAELNDLTNWVGAPWKWNFGNKNGNGYTDRYDGYAYYQTEVLPEGGKGRKTVKHHLVYRDEAWFAAHDEAHGVTQTDEQAA